MQGAYVRRYVVNSRICFAHSMWFGVAITSSNEQFSKQQRVDMVDADANIRNGVKVVMGGVSSLTENAVDPSGRDQQWPYVMGQ